MSSLTDLEDMYDDIFLRRAIARLDGATDEERAALLEVFDVQGFGGAEYAAVDDESAAAVATGQLEWLRDECSRQEEAAAAARAARAAEAAAEAADDALAAAEAAAEAAAATAEAAAATARAEAARDAARVAWAAYKIASATFAAINTDTD